MIKLLACWVAISLVSVSGLASAAAHKPSEISVAYFQKWPTPNQFAQLKKTYDSALGVTVNWVPFASGYDMNEAMAAGEVQIAYAQGHVPFVVGVSRGLDLTMVGIAVSHSQNDLCLLRNDSGIGRANANELEGRKVASLIGNVTHYRLLKVLAHLKVDPAKIDIVPMQDAASVAAAFRSGEVVMACAFGAALRDMSEIGTPLMTAAELEGLGLRVFDIVAVQTGFMKEHPDLVQRFMDVTEASNSQWKANPDPMRATIARAAEMNQSGADKAMAGFAFPSAHEQRSGKWMGEMVVDYTKAIADFFVDQGQLDKSLDRAEYQARITIRFLR